MSTIQVSIKFKDNDSKISFDLTKNNVFYGNNGKGKTRILKAIELLYGLAKTMNYDSLISQLNELNLSELTINQKNHAQLFSKYEKNTENDRANFSEFIKANNQLISHLYEILSIANKQYPTETPNPEYKKITTTHLLAELEHILKTPEKYSTAFFQELITNVLEKIASEDQLFYRSLFFYSKNIQKRRDQREIIYLLRYILQKIQDFKFSTKQQDNQIRRELEHEKEKVLKILGKKGARYLTVNSLIESEKIFKEIGDIFRNINNELIYDEWFNKESKSKNQISSYTRKFKTLNKIISNYNPFIKIQYDHNGNISFKKNDTEIDFEKMSSGEKRLCIIFLNIIFSEEDIILIDEPEISLSLDYQNKIIGDIMSVAKNKKIMIATHAPYIYEDFINHPGNEKVKV